MRISQFFDEVLGTPLANFRWSWGAEDERGNRVYLRVWEDEIKPWRNGKRVLVLRKDHPRRKSAGYPQRLKHLESIKNGAEGIGVVCVGKPDPDTGRRAISNFDRDKLLRFDGLVEDKNGDVYATIAEQVPLSQIMRPKR